MTEARIKRTVKQILDRLKREYDSPRQQLHGDPISVLVQTILSQNTSDVNSTAAYQSLLASFDKWEHLADADVDTVAHYIKRGGLGRIKAQRLIRALKEIIRQRGRLELDFLSQLALPSAQDWLRRLPGVGLKTACCVLLFSLGIPALPVDTHVLRVTKRLGLINPMASLDEAHYELGKAVPPDDVYQFHVLVIEHGRKICRARYPKCQYCVLEKICPSLIQ